MKMANEWQMEMADGKNDPSPISHLPSFIYFLGSDDGGTMFFSRM